MQVNATRSPSRANFAPVAVNLVLESQAELDAFRQVANWHKPVAHKVANCIANSKKPDRAFDPEATATGFKRIYAALKRL